MTVKRRSQWDRTEQTLYDAAIIGGGVKGACLFDQLCRAGYRVLLIEKGDFGGGTSQASALMVWGGLLYLRNGDIATVARLCRARERMVREMGAFVRPRPVRYLPAPVAWRECGRSSALVRAALHFYWLLGGCRRKRPRLEVDFPERAFLNRDFRESLAYEEAFVEPSDSRLVLNWLLAHQGTRGTALNHCALNGGGFDRSSRTWRLELADTLGSRRVIARARCVVNAAGVWTDAINQRFGMATPYRHVFSRGVSVSLKRDPRHKAPLAFETGGGDCRAFTPWGPVALYGPTETKVNRLEDGFAPRREDVALLLRELNRYLDRPVSEADVVSLRCGARAVAVRRDAPNPEATQHLSRRFHVHCDRDAPWISLYGGNLTQCLPIAEAAAKAARNLAAPSSSPAKTGDFADATRIEYERFPGLEGAVPSARWCAEREMCCALDDYLRRRTNIAQWIPRGGLGWNDENLPHLAELARVFSPSDPDAVLEAYRAKIAREDALLLRRAPHPEFETALHGD